MSIQKDTDLPFWQLKAELPRLSSLQVQTALRPRDTPQHTSRTSRMSRRSPRQRETGATSEAHWCIMFDNYSDLKRVEHYGNLRAALLTLRHQVRGITNPAARLHIWSDSASVRLKLDRFKAGFVDRVPAVSQFVLSRLELLRLRKKDLALLQEGGQSEALNKVRISMQTAQGVLHCFEVEQGIACETGSWLYRRTQSRACQQFDNDSNLEQIEHYGNLRAALLMLSHQVQGDTNAAAPLRI
ncbi:hypothetical protein CBOM_00114 [Ceraceosorus bombacis]|uniref:Uncharacterized protein n=1 Tax=Ceraceosorus bombacis TaxID=401625 RepID=A0A0P1B848_9BASI|nr:hypothetical protein CBOM_00114 [Ceraceosorus bombacis]